MLQSILADVRKEFAMGNVVNRLIIINVAVFIIVNLVKLSLNLANQGELPPFYRTFVEFFSISSSILHNVTHPWVFITSIFLHERFWHILWNMLFLYWFGRIVGDMIGDRKIFPLYLLGGLVGCFVFWMSAQFMPFGAGGTVYALGASAGVMSIVVASGMIAPDYNMRLLLIGDVRLKYIVFFLVLLDVFALGGDVNTGGHFAHLGGAFMGWFFVQQLRVGNDWSDGVNNIMSKIIQFFSEGRPQNRTTKERTLVVKKNYHKNTETLSKDEIQDRVDIILDKIKASGYDSLSREEKEFLNNASSD